MKRVISLLCVFVCIFTLFCSFSLPVNALETIDTERNSSITVTLKYGDRAFEGFNLKLYRIADVFEDGTYKLSGDFNNYPVDIYGIASQTEWKEIASTFISYIAADEIKPIDESLTDKEGKAVFSDLLPGMYLVDSARIESEKDIIVFESFITVLPYYDSVDEYIYDTIVFPKAEEYIPKPGNIEYNVVKQWKDNGYRDKRPDKILIELYKDGVLQSKEYLTPANNWSYSWTAKDDGSVWNVVERNIDKIYTVSIVKNGKTFIITNAYDGNEKIPQTGDSTSLWPYIISSCFAGILLIILAIWRKRIEE